MAEHRSEAEARSGQRELCDVAGRTGDATVMYCDEKYPERVE